MLRSVTLFKKQGLQPIPAPVNFQVKEAQESNPDTYFRKGDHLQQVETAWHEYLELV
jgi:uncharacterized SAM-binding protein YcdF (DUF218 family)